MLRDGAAGLTMRALAAEAGCALGLPYKVFADRRELVLEIVQTEMAQLAIDGETLVGRAGERPIGANLTWFAERILDSPAVMLAAEILSDATLGSSFERLVERTATGPPDLQASYTAYLIAEQRAGRIDPAVDASAFGSVLAAAIHNLAICGPSFPQPTRRQLRRRLDAIAARLTL